MILDGMLDGFCGMGLVVSQAMPTRGLKRALQLDDGQDGGAKDSGSVVGGCCL